MPSRHHLQHVIESAIDFGIIVTDLEGRVTDWNAGAEGILGWSREEMVGGPAERIFTPEDRAADRMAYEMRSCLADGRASDERWHLRKDGNRFWASGEMMPLRTENGAHHGYVKILRDRTRQREAGRRLRESEDRYRTLLETIDTAFAIVEVKFDSDDRPIDYRFLEANSAFERQTGVDLRGKWVTEFAPNLERFWFETYGRVAKTGEPAAFENHAKDFGRWFDVRAIRIGEPADRQIAILFTDVTARRQLQARNEAIQELSDRLSSVTETSDVAFAAAETLAKALQASLVGYGTVDVQAETVTVERDWAAAGSRELPQTIRFRDYGSYIEDLFKGETVAVSDAVLDPRTAGFAADLEAIGARAFINLPLFEHGRWVALVYVGQNEARRWTEDEILFVREVTERVRAATERVRRERDLRESEARLLRAQADLRALNETLEQRVVERTEELMHAEERLRQSQKMEAVGQLTGGVAHDFNNLLAGISGSLELMNARLTQGRVKDVEKYMAAAQGATKRAAALTHRLLAFSRRQTLDPRPTNVKSLVTGMTDLIQRTVGPSIEIETKAEDGLWTTLVDPSQLENALLNLCINARDAMPDGGRVVIETSNKQVDYAAASLELPEGEYLSLCVTDTGTGMPPDVIAKAFDPFFTTKPIGQGTGLGLSMIYGFAKQSGGQVRIESQVGHGTTVCIYLPRHWGRAEEDEVRNDTGIAPLAGAGDTVLVVDDEPTVRMLVGDVLDELGYSSIEAADSIAGLKVLQSDVHIDLLITDVGLPGGMNGRQLADAARAKRAGLKVLFITGFAENALIKHGELDKGMSVLTKPFAMDTMAAVIRELIAQ